MLKEVCEFVSTCKNFTIKKQLQNMEMCQSVTDGQKTEDRNGVTDNSSTKEACAFKNVCNPFLIILHCKEIILI